MTYKNDPTLEQIIPKKKAIMDLAKLNNIDTEQADDMEVTQMKKDIMNELQTAMK
jgi:soluble P-type ATPase